MDMFEIFAFIALALLVIGFVVYLANELEKWRKSAEFWKNQSLAKDEYNKKLYEKYIQALGLDKPFVFEEISEDATEQ